MTPALSPKQYDFLTTSDATVNVLDGSIRSGKTIVSLLRWYGFMARAPRGGELVMIGRTRDAIFRNVIKPMQDESLFGPLAATVKYTNGAPTATILGRTVHIIGASDAKAEKSIRGMTVAGAYVDEITVIPEEFFTQLLGRMSVAGAKLFGTTNPDSPAHWFKAKFLNKIGLRDAEGQPVLPGWKYWHFVMDDNPSLTEDYKRRKRAEFTGLWFRRFILGEWVAAEGAIYDTWDPDRHVIPFDNLPNLRDLVAIGVDYGTTNATAALLLGITAELNPRLVFVDEWRYQAGENGARWTDAQLSTGLRDWMASISIPGQPHLTTPSWVFLDPAAASFRVQLGADGLQTFAAENDVKYGIQTFASLLGADRLIVTDRCPDLIREIPGYSWDDKAALRGEDKPVKVDDHSLDAARYAVTTTERHWRQYINLALAA
ncbi:PBSX family phage terminase large subunit [Cellulosimicrobium sp. XJ-DQ-B-000]|uniref:PBSX family phage terminase large subunit n=1 Tax=Cellulosimicrobium sp. XJ-DQ-B-000 TaxID=3072182 RepID=UPI0028096ADB|nr:PBSX family phage terminase large subunit [Cellulosimicrobium sp. XJ-DQ-B-000]MDQ8040657.1 PBSX family phage terminase large subunit [Cellulosimicrobium sp. XJ-DQ-B-000]